MRLTRVGSKKNPVYRVVVADSRSPRDGKFIEIVGRYNPQHDPSLIEFDEDKVKDWLGKGALPSEAVSRLLKIRTSQQVVAELLEYLARQLVDEPDAVRVERVDEADALVLRLHVAQDDLGKVIGQQGRIARALRTVVRARQCAGAPPRAARDRRLARYVNTSETVVVGRVGKSHGLDGSFVVENASEAPERFEVGAELIVEGEPAKVVASKQARGRPVIRLDRRVSRGAQLEVPRESLAPTGEDEYYVFQLVGLRVEEEGGTSSGRSRTWPRAWRTTCSSSIPASRCRWSRIASSSSILMPDGSSSRPASQAPS